MLQYRYMRRSRYIRQPVNLPHRLTSRDAKILQQIDQFKYLTSKQLADLMATSRQAIDKRLKLLFHHHYIGKLPALLSPKLFNSPDVYFVDLNRKTSRILSSRNISLPHQKRHAVQRPKREYLQHTLLINDILISVACAVRGHSQYDFLSSHELLAGSKRFHQSHPGKVTAFLPEQNISRTAYPDAAFVLLDKDSGKTQLFLVEADRMTQPLARKHKNLFRVSNIKAKLIIYHNAWQQGVFRERFQLPATRILFVTLSAERARHMKTLTKSLFDGQVPGLFVFTTIDNLNSKHPAIKRLLLL